MYRSQEELEQAELRSTREHLLRVKRAALQGLQNHGLIDGETATELAESIDGSLLMLRRRMEPQLGDDHMTEEFSPIDDLLMEADAAAEGTGSTAIPARRRR